jgi:hypothetical protein
MVFVNEDQNAGSPLMDSLGLEPKFRDQCCLADGAAVVAGDGLLAYV